MELTRPLLLYDGDCSFCTSCARCLERISPGVDVAAWQRTDLTVLPVSAAEASEAVQLIGADGTVRSGHEAIAAALLGAGPGWRLVGRALVAPGVSSLAAGGYRLVAANRGSISRVFRKLSGST